MTINVHVTNKTPDYATSTGVDLAALELFRAYMADPTALPFRHQADTWQEVFTGGQVRLVAGTAAGKTLAISVPLVTQLFQQRTVGKVIFIYPTRALLEDQGRVLRKLVACAGQSEDVIG